MNEVGNREGLSASAVELLQRAQVDATLSPQCDLGGDALPEGTPDFSASKSDELVVTLDDQRVEKRGER